MELLVFMTALVFAYLVGVIVGVVMVRGRIW